MQTKRDPQSLRRDLEAELRRVEASTPRHPAFQASRLERIEAIRAELATLPPAPTAEEIAAEKDAAAAWRRFSDVQRADSNADRRERYDARYR